MSTAITDLQIRLMMTGIQQFNAGLERIAGQFAHAGSILTAFGAAMGIAFSTEKIFEATKATIEHGKELEHLSQRTGIAVESLVTLQRAFADAGVAGDRVGEVISKMQRTIFESATSGKHATDAFYRLGTSARELRSLAPEQQFGVIAEKIAALPDPAQRAAIAMQIFGRSAGDLLPIFTRGKFDEIAKSLGNTPALWARNAEAFARISSLITSISGKSQGFFLGFLDQIGGSFEKIATLINKIDFVPLGQAFGAWVAVAIDMWNQGKLGEFIGLTIQAGFELGMDAAKNITIKGIDLLFSLDALQIVMSFGVKVAEVLLHAMKLPLDFLSAGMVWVMGKAEKAWDGFINLLQEGIAAFLNFFGHGLETILNKAVALFNKIKTMFGGTGDTGDFKFKEFKAKPTVTPEITFADALKASQEGNADSLKTVTNFLDKSLKDSQSIVATWKGGADALNKQKTALQQLQTLLLGQKNKRDAQGGGKKKESNPIVPQAGLFDEAIVAIGKMKDAFLDVSKQIATAFTTVIGSAVGSISEGIQGLIKGTMTWGQALSNIGTSILNSVIKAIADMFARWIVGMILQFTIGKALQAASLATGAGMAAGFAASWAAPATLATIASYGGAAVAAPPAIMAAEGEVAAMSLFQSGGYTGNGPANQIAGMVHGREWVVPADRTSQLGLGFLTNLTYGSRSGGSASEKSSSTVQVHVGQFATRQQMRDFMASEGKKMVLEELGRRSNKISV